MNTSRTDDFCKTAVRIALMSELSPRQVADDLRIGMSTLNRWVGCVANVADPRGWATSA